MIRFDPSILIPGDVVLYQGYAIVRDWTHSDVGHATAYVGVGTFSADRRQFTPTPLGTPVVATADVDGVGFYALDQMDEIVRVKRPSGTFDLDAALSWFKTVAGLPYGWWDTLGDAFGNLSSNDPHCMNCSHTTSSFVLAGGIPLVDSLRNPHFITPRDLDYSAACQVIWTEGDSFLLKRNSPTGPQTTTA